VHLDEHLPVAGLGLGDALQPDAIGHSVTTMHHRAHGFATRVLARYRRAGRIVSRHGHAGRDAQHHDGADAEKDLVSEFHISSLEFAATMPPAPRVLRSMRRTTADVRERRQARMNSGRGGASESFGRVVWRCVVI
jgi:hypothetical protein